MRIRLPASEDYLELTPGDQAAFLLGGAAGFAADLFFTLGLSGGVGAMAGASAGVGLKRGIEAILGRGKGQRKTVEEEADALHAILTKAGETRLATRLERYRSLKKEGLLDEAGLRARIDEIIDDFAEGAGQDEK